MSTPIASELADDGAACARITPMCINGLFGCFTRQNAHGAGWEVHQEPRRTADDDRQDGQHEDYLAHVHY
jgi:hypothetical protein